MPSTLTVDAIADEVKTQLGNASVEVEAEDDDFEKAITDAVRVYNRNRPRRRKAALAVTSSQKKYGPLNTGATTAPGLPVSGAIFGGVVGCEFITSNNPIVDPFDNVGQSLSKVLSAPNAGTFGEVEQALQYTKMAREVASAEPEWYGQWENDGYYLYADIVRNNMSCSYTYTFNITPDDVGLAHLDQGDEDWIVGFVAARIKQIVGRKRNKFGGIAGSDGGNEEVDGDKLLEEAKEEEEKLLEEIKARRRPLLPVIG